MGLSLLPLLLLAVQRPADIPAEAAAARARADRVLIVSVDGLRSDALLALPAEELPGFARLRRGPSTLNARADPDVTVTLPNHTSMLTGRLQNGAGGHGWTWNDDPREGETLHSVHGSYLPGAFDVAHDRGVSTALLVGKTKFSLYDLSWGAEHGAPDAEGEDDGADKLDLYRCLLDPAELTAEALAVLRGAPRALVLLHYAAPDLAGHAAGWDLSRGSRYLEAVRRVDGEIARLLDAIEAEETLRGRTAIVLTADHGGGAPQRSHDQPHMWIDYIVPFLVWTGDAEPRDLYALNARTRADPGLGRPRPGDPGLPPVRNGDAANLALSLLGLPPVPGSTINALQDLALR